MKSKVDSNFFKVPLLKKIWYILAGSIFLPLENNEILQILRTYLKSETKNLPASLKNGFKNFILYLDKFYFNACAPFNPGFYPYYDLITVHGNFSTSTNALESINRQLKNAAGSGFLSFSRSLRTIRDFKINYLLLHEDRVRNDNFNRRTKSTKNREKQLEAILTKFFEMSSEEQLSNVIDTAFSIGSMDKFVALSNNLDSTNIDSPVTTEEELDETNYSQFDDSDSD